MDVLSDIFNLNTSVWMLLHLYVSCSSMKSVRDGTTAAPISVHFLLNHAFQFKLSFCSHGVSTSLSKTMDLFSFKVRIVHTFCCQMH